MKRNIYSPLLILLTAGSVFGGIITFDTPTYSTGNLSNQTQDGITWSGSSDYQVVSGAGVSSSQGLEVNYATFQTISFTPDAAFLGVSSNDATGQFDYSFSVTLNDMPDASQSYGAMTRLFLTQGDGGPGIYVSDAGRIIPSKDDTNTYTMAQGETASVSGIIDFDASTYSVSVNGSLLTDGMGFTKGSDYGDLLFKTGGHSAGDHKSYTFDDISLAVVPEPTTVASILGLLTLGLVCLRRRSR